MDMSSFWGQVINKVSPLGVALDYPAAFQAAKDDGMEGKAEFAFDVIPAIGPGGCTSEEDELAYGEGDGEEDAGRPSLSGKLMLMAYRFDIDELYTFQDGKWLCWNY